MIENDHPDLVLLDVNMPEMDGYQVCRKIRDDCTTALLPVVLFTGSRVEERVKGLESGADDFLIKPVNQLELLAKFVLF